MVSMARVLDTPATPPSMWLTPRKNSTFWIVESYSSEGPASTEPARWACGPSFGAGRAATGKEFGVTATFRRVKHRTTVWTRLCRVNKLSRSMLAAGAAIIFAHYSASDRQRVELHYP